MNKNDKVTSTNDYYCCQNLLSFLNENIKNKSLVQASACTLSNHPLSLLSALFPLSLLSAFFHPTVL